MSISEHDLRYVHSIFPFVLNLVENAKLSLVTVHAPSIYYNQNKK